MVGLRVRRRFLGASIIALVLLAAGGGFAREAGGFTPTQRSHWAWKKPAAPSVPKVRGTAWVLNPADAFILAKLEAQNLKPAPAAPKERLIRRVAFNLTGLPPTPEEIDLFLADATPGAYERMVDRYLESPAYGERMARLWLDLARYADSNGYEHDEVRPDAWRYRDYVVRSFNADKPYDRFIMEQLAGDELAPEDPEALVATGFNLLGPDMTDAADQVARRHNTLNDMTDTAGLVFLGLTVGCARCHDHKYEPITQVDYFRLQAFFQPARFRTDLPVGSRQDQLRYARAQAEHAAKVKAARGRVDAVAGPVRERLIEEKVAKLPEDVQTAFRLPPAERTADQQKLVDRHQAQVEPAGRELIERLPEEVRPAFEEASRQLRAVAAEKPEPPPAAMGLWEEGFEAPKTYVLERGEVYNRGQEVTAGLPSILARGAPAITPPAQRPSSGRRLALAKWIASRDNPLTARVMVNRIWQQHFGRGILPTPSDFGLRGESPTHPELLDWLATRFSGASRAAGTKPWSLKDLHRLILTSNTFKQSAHVSAETLAADPENRLFSRMNRTRLEAEMVRDAALAVSGRLNRKPGGPGVFPPIPEEALPKGAAWPVTKDPAEHTRRSLYVFVRRNLHFPAFEAFDSPDTNLSCARREVTTTAPQALSLLNAPDVLENARRFAGRVLAAEAAEVGRIALAYRLALGRMPTHAETRTGREFLTKQSELLRGREPKTLLSPTPAQDRVETPAGAAWVDYCLALLNLNEFVYLD